MQDQWLPVLDHCLPIALSHIFNQLKEDICQMVDLVIWVHKKLHLQEVYTYPHYVNPWEMTILPGGNESQPNVLETEYLPILD